MTDEELTEIYNAANGLDPKRHNPITTERIFAAMRAAMAEERMKCWNEINAAIKQGTLQGNGCDDSAQRNGLVLASNIIMREILKDVAGAPPQRRRA